MPRKNNLKYLNKQKCRAHRFSGYRDLKLQTDIHRSTFVVLFCSIHVSLNLNEIKNQLKDLV